jgi:rRNA maturation RNase YbeY
MFRGCQKYTGKQGLSKLRFGFNAILPVDTDRAAAPSPGDAAFFAGPPGRRVHLGDIVLSVERAAEQAEAGRGGQTGDVRWSVADELRLLVTHGALHICGWDHADPAEEREMRALEQRLLAGGR